MAIDETSITVYEGSLYTVEERLETFSKSHWPFDSGPCTPIKMAEAGFYFCGTISTPDWVRCVVCHHEMDGWEETDIPWEEHVQHKPSCPFIQKIKDPYAITVGEALELEKFAIKARVKLAADEFVQDAIAIWERISEKLIEAMNSLPDD